MGDVLNEPELTVTFTLKAGLKGCYCDYFQGPQDRGIDAWAVAKRLSEPEQINGILKDLTERGALTIKVLDIASKRVVTLPVDLSERDAEGGLFGEGDE